MYTDYFKKSPIFNKCLSLECIEYLTHFIEEKHLVPNDTIFNRN